MAQRKRRRRGTAKVSAWSRGEQRNAKGLTLQEIGGATLRLINQRRRLLPKCGAKTRLTGEPCRNSAMDNGRCWLHGGLTPKGDQWHVRQVPSGKAKNDLRKYDAKLRKAEKAAAVRRLRLMRATDAEREAYKKWLWARPAGSAAKRAARRAETRMRRRIAEEKQELARDLRLETTDPDIRAMELRIAELRKYLAFLREAKSGVFE